MSIKPIAHSVLALLAFAISLSACKNDDNPTTATPTSTFMATLNGANEKPASTTSPATGMFMGSLNEATRVLSYTLTYSGFPTSSTVTAGHLHRVIPGDAAGVNGANPSPEIPFASLASPIMGTATLPTQGRVDSLKNGFYYANIHSTQFPSGAIRGNLTRQ